MTQPRPTAPELLAAVRTFLVDDLLPDLEGRARFHARVAANVLEMVERELADGPPADRNEHEGLVALLGEDRAATDPAAPVRGGVAGGDPVEDGPDDRTAGSVGSLVAERSVDELARDLAGRIRRGEVDIDDPRLVDHLRRTATADVAITNPRWLDRPVDDHAGISPAGISPPDTPAVDAPPAVSPADGS